MVIAEVFMHVYARVSWENNNLCRLVCGKFHKSCEPYNNHICKPVLYGHIYIIYTYIGRKNT